MELKVKNKIKKSGKIIFFFFWKQKKNIFLINR